jgi:hypothetical protein
MNSVFIHPYHHYLMITRHLYIFGLLLPLFLAVTFLAESQGLPPGWEYVFTPSVHVIAISTSVQPSINGEPIVPGDYIGVFYVRGDSLVCGGAAEWPGDASIAVVANGDDFLTTIKDGFSEEEDFHWKIYSWQYEQEYDAVAEYDTTLPNYDGKFYTNGLSALTSLQASLSSLVVAASADPTEVCAGDSCQLHADPAFGSGDYTYSWTSIPPGFYSEEKDPVVFPQDTTLYVIEVNDGYSSATDSVTVNVILTPEVSAGNDASICSGDSYINTGTVTDASSIYWTTSGDGSFDDPASPSARYTPGPEDLSSGQAVLTLTAYPFPPCDQPVSDQMTLVINENPVADAGNDVIIAYGSSTQLSGNASGGSGNYSYFWAPEAYLIDPTVQNPVTVALTQTVIFTLTITDAITGCHGSDHVTVFLSGGPLTLLVMADPEAVCPGNPSQLQAIPSGGSGNYGYSWTSNPPGFLSGLANPVVYLQQTTIYTVEVSDGYSTVTDSVEVTVNPVPVADAGEDITIPYGTSTTLNGSASGGSENYFYHWTPAFFLTDPTIQNPVTINLYETVTFELTVTDEVFGCHDVDAVTVNVSGAPLAVKVTAMPDNICMGDTAHLSALASGGSGTYTFLWTSDPSGFSSTDPNPPVSPGMTTEYFVVVNDGYDNVSGSIIVTVHPLPDIQITAYPNDTVCQNEVIRLDAITTGAVSYLWIPGNYLTPVIYVDTTGAGIGSELFRVLVTDGYGCQNMDSILVTFDECIGISELTGDNAVQVFPNPAAGRVYVSIKGLSSFQLALMNLYGEILLKRTIDDIKDGTLIPLDISRLASGIYLIRIQSKDDISFIKIIKK